MKQVQTRITNHIQQVNNSKYELHCTMFF